eukprot:5901243-Pleurochrysis_carterae.AAC.1
MSSGPLASRVGAWSYCLRTGRASPIAWFKVWQRSGRFKPSSCSGRPGGESSNSIRSVNVK